MYERELEALFMGNRECDAYLKENTARLLSLVRFAAEHEIVLTGPMRAAMEAAGKRRTPFSAEEAGVELERILMSGAPGMIRALQETDTLRLFLPEVAACFAVSQNNPNHIYSVGEHTLRVVEGVPPIRELRWAAFLHDTGKTRTHTTDMYGIDHFHGHEAASVRIADSVLRRLGISGKETILTLIEYHDMPIKEKDVASLMRTIGAQTFFMLLDLKESDTAAKSALLRETRHEELLNLREIGEKEKRGLPNETN